MPPKYIPSASGARWPVALAVIAVTFSSAGTAQPARPALRDLGIRTGIFEPGPNNAVTDVHGVLVGHRTVDKDTTVRTGVTALLPHGGNLFRHKVPAAVVVGNGFGKLVGSTQVNELGNIEAPIVLTNTLSVWDAARASVRHVLAMPGNDDVGSVNPVVGETNDGFLNDIRSMAVTESDVLDAIRSARGGPVEQGSVGAGRGTVCFGWKGGIGTSSRVLPASLGGYTVGALVQSNYGGVLDIAGVPVGRELGRYTFRDQVERGDGSCMIVVATDAPLDARQLERVGRRALLALGRTGSSMSNGSGDYVIAFSAAPSVRITRTEPDTVTRLPMEALSPIFQATVEAVEEAILNSLLKATTVQGRGGRTVEAIDAEKVRRILEKYGRTKDIK